MTQAGQHSMWGGKKWINPYSTDGLVAMWDAEWNAGRGKHDASARMVDLSGNGADATLFAGSPVVGSNFIKFDGASALHFNASDELGALTSSSCCIEIVGKFESTADNELMVCLNPQNASIYVCFGYRSAGSWGLFSSFYNYNSQAQVMRPYPRDSHQYVCTSDGSSCRHYVNNVLKRTDTAASLKPFTVPCSDGFIGYGTDLDLYLRGKFYSMRLYNSIPNDSTRQARYEIDKARFGLT